MTTNESSELLYNKLNHETAQMPWTELLRYFASGSVIAVSDELDLIDVAARIADDDKEMVAAWLADQRLAKVTDEQAKAWLDADMSLWTVVVKPWILVQQGQPAQPAGGRMH